MKERGEKREMGRVEAGRGRQEREVCFERILDVTNGTQN